MRPAQQIGILCQDARFRKFLGEKTGTLMSDEGAADTIRRMCEVHSRADILDGTQAARKWTAIHNEYQAWRLVG